jgi:hypothetical protein
MTTPQQYVAQGQTVYNALYQAGNGDIGPMVGLAGGLAQGIDPGSTAGRAIKDAFAGASTGAAIGSVVPGVGTVVGAAIGVVFGTIFGLLSGGPTDNRPLWLQKAEQVRLPGGESNPTQWSEQNNFGSNQPAPDQILGNYFAGWWMTHLHGYVFGSDQLHYDMGTNLAQSILSSDCQFGSLITAAGGNDPINRTAALWNRWVIGPDPLSGVCGHPGSLPDRPINPPGASPIYFPDDNDSFGWTLNNALWIIAAQGYSDKDVLQWATMVQWVMTRSQQGGPTNEAHLMYLIGRMHELLGSPTISAGGLVIVPGLHLILTPPASASKPLSTPAKVAVGTGVVAAGVAGAAALVAWREHASFMSVLSRWWRSTGGRVGRVARRL